jgi:head-tail adaptor
MISGGVLRFTATRLAASTGRDQIGLRTDTWTESGTFRCDVRNDSASESTLADGVAVRRMYEIRARWRQVQNIELTEADRLTVRGRTLRINSIRNLGERDRVAVIMAEEVN